MLLESLITALVKQIEWTSKFDEDDLATLTRELITAFIMKEYLDTLLYEWKETALAIDNTELLNSFKELTK